MQGRRGKGGGGIQRLQTTDGFGCETARAIHKEVRAKSKPTAALLIDAVLPSVLRRFLIDEAGHVSSPLCSGPPYFSKSWLASPGRGRKLLVNFGDPVLGFRV